MIMGKVSTGAEAVVREDACEVMNNTVVESNETVSSDSSIRIAKVVKGDVDGHKKVRDISTPLDDIDKKAKNKALYNSWVNNEDYYDVCFDEESGGVKAIHRDHNFDAEGGKYEKMAMEAGFNNGDSVVLEKETGGTIGQRFPDGKWNGMLLEIVSCNGGSANNILKAFKHCAGKKVEVAVLVFRQDYDEDTFKTAFKRYEGLNAESTEKQYVKFKQLIVIGNDGTMIKNKDYEAYNREIKNGTLQPGVGTRTAVQI